MCAPVEGPPIDSPSPLPATPLRSGLLADGAKCAIWDPKVEAIQMFRDLSAPKYAWDRPHGWTKSEHHIMENVQARGAGG